MASSSGEAPTTVTIYGRTYHLRGSDDPDHLSSLAAELDRRMREVAEATGTADTLKVAILAALNVTDEYSRTDRSAGLLENAEKRLARLATLLDEVLIEEGDRPTGAARGRTE